MFVDKTLNNLSFAAKRPRLAGEALKFVFRAGWLPAYNVQGRNKSRTHGGRLNSFYVFNSFNLLKYGKNQLGATQQLVHLHGKQLHSPLSLPPWTCFAPVKHSLARSYTRSGLIGSLKMQPMRVKNCNNFLK